MNKFSYFKAPITNKTLNKTIDIKEYVSEIKSEKWRETSLLIRSKEKSARNEIKKKQLGYITPSGTFSTRSKDGLISLSGLICWDLDGLEKVEEIKEKLSQDPHVLLVHLSPSGNGLKLFSRFDGLTEENYEQNWGMGKEYFITKCKVPPEKFDENTKDLPRACFVSWDPDLFYNENSKKFEATNENLGTKSKEHLKSKSDKKIIKIMVPYWIEEQRNNLSLSLSGFLRKKGYGIDRIKSIINSICLESNDEDKKDRMGAVDWTFRKEEKGIRGYSGLKDFLSQKDLASLCGKEKESKDYILNYRTSHMPHFDNLNRIINLFGKDYRVVAKAVYYHVVGNALKKHEIINYQGLSIDTRIPLYFFLNSGSGKSNIKHAIKKTLPSCFLTWSEVTSLHPEQLIGKMKEFGRGKDKKIKEVPGYFKNDLVLIDEARQLFTSKELKHQEIRGYTCIALDTFGKNEVTKQSVDFGSENQLKYEANCSMVLFSQPVRIKREVIESGFIRRGLMIGGIKQSPRREVYEKRLNAVNTDKDVEIFSEFTDEIFGMESGWEFEDIRDELIDYASKLSNFARTHSKKASEYVNKIYGQTLLDTLLKFACIAAVFTRGEKVVKKCDVETAYADLFEILNSSFGIINSYSESFYEFDMDAIEYDVLDWLYDSGATSEEKSTISIKKLKEKISEMEEIGEDAAKKRYTSFRERGFIETKLSGNVSTVWISEDKLRIFEERADGESHYEEYLRISEGVKGDKQN
jgi:hypothetical protein